MKELMAKKYTETCDHTDCNERYYARGLCKKHYKQLLGREGGYIKEYQKRKDRPEYKEMKLKSDKAYVKRLKDMGLWSKKQKEYYINYISKKGNRDLVNLREKLRYANRNEDQKWHERVLNRIRNDIARYEVMNHYSKGKMCCANCGIDVYPLLTIDHINNDGAKHRREITKGKSLSSALYKWLIKNNYPDGFQVLCQNCNFFKDMILRIERQTKK